MIIVWVTAGGFDLKITLCYSFLNNEVSHLQSESSMMGFHLRNNDTHTQKKKKRFLFAIFNIQFQVLFILSTCVVNSLKKHVLQNFEATDNVVVLWIILFALSWNMRQRRIVPLLILVGVVYLLHVSLYTATEFNSEFYHLIIPTLIILHDFFLSSDPKTLTLPEYIFL